MDVQIRNPNTFEIERINDSTPIYPISARRNLLEGWVDIEYTVDVDGRVQNANVFNANGDKSFEASAPRFILDSRYTPALEGSVPIESNNDLRIYYAMNSSPKGTTRKFLTRYNKFEKNLHKTKN